MTFYVPIQQEIITTTHYHYEYYECIYVEQNKQKPKMNRTKIVVNNLNQQQQEKITTSVSDVKITPTKILVTDNQKELSEFK